MNRQEIEERLDSPEDEVRYRSVALIAELEDEEDVRDLLVECLGDSSWRVRKAAGDQVVSLPKSSETIVRLIDSLADGENAGRRNAAAEVLTRIGSGSVYSLLGKIEAHDSDVRKLIVDILGDIGQGVAVDALVSRLGDADENVRGAAAEALGKIGGPEAEQALVGILGERDLLGTLSALDALARAGVMVPLNRLRPLLSKRLLMRPALVLLARVGEDEALERILDALSDPSRGTREAGLAALARWKDAHDVKGERLKSAVSSRDPVALGETARAGLAAEDVWVRAAGLDLLSLIGEAEAAPAIVHSAGDERLRERALLALRRLGPKAAPPLLRSLDRLPAWGQALALEGLSQCASEEAVSSIASFLEHEDEDVRLAAVDTLRELSYPVVVEPLARLLGWPDGPLAGAIVRALIDVAEQQPALVLQACKRRLDDPDPRRVADACRVLSAAGSPADIPLLRAVLRREDPRAREAAAEALGSLRCDDALVQLRFALADESPRVRVAAALALGRHGGADAIDALLVALRDEDPMVIGAAAEALGRTDGGSLGHHLLPLLGDGGSPGHAPAAYSALMSIARLGAPELEQALHRAAAHPEGEVAKGAVTVAESISTSVGTQVLLACARHRAWDVRFAAAKAMAKRRDYDLVDEVRALAKREHDEMVAEALREAARAIEESVR